MASYGIAITLPLPMAGQVQWDGPLSDLIQQLIDVLAQRVTTDGMDIGKALDMQGHALIDATAVEFVTNGDPGIANSIYYSSGGELFCRDGTNRPIQLTAGGVVNVAGSGGFGGDYVSSNQNGASFTNATNTFTFTVAGGTSYATMENGEVKIHQGSSANSVGLRAPTSLTTYELTLPGALPGDDRTLLTADATGTVAFTLTGSILTQTPGRWIARQVFAATGPYTPSTKANSLHIRIVGGGGGGGAADLSSANAGSAAGGGAGGVYVEDFRTIVPISGNVYVGAAGSGGTTGPAIAGSPGGSTILRITGSNGNYVYTVPGGLGGAVAVSTTNDMRPGGGLSAVPTLTIGGTSVGFIGASMQDEGKAAQTISAALQAKSGMGGSTPLGAGGGSVSLLYLSASQSPGKPGYGNGAGGGGACSVDGGTAAAGGNGATGYVIIDEYR